MVDLKQRLLEILYRLGNEGDYVGVAIAINPDTSPAAVWLPSWQPSEPIFLAYSITKTFTAALLLLLQEEGRLSLHDPLARWLPAITQSDRISLTQLLNHTSGIPDYGALQTYQDGVRSSPSIPWSFEQFAAATFDQGLSFAPGTRWAYSNPGYMLLKHIAEAVTGESYAQLIADRIAQPLGLHQTFVPQSVADLSSLAPALSYDLTSDRHPKDVRHAYHPGWVSHGVVASTPSDIVLFLHQLFGGRLLPQQCLEEMTALVPVPLPRPTQSPASAPPRWVQPGYGLGLMGDSASPWGLILGHNGGGPGYSTSVFHAPELGGISVCAMGAIEARFQAEEVVFAVFDSLKADS
ncbi:beta-lactamase family protein [Oscillatoria sp. FACHB-1407]|uniref:serine hydrolase domain-containing protein n=1 Tax=Oscillatoria sp. FACHB-1407 TaxID=2692847 RepID=UPI0016865821|nr:serine hydrolase domain-containing protein [Oscillatoria sp. FACHB-1407]MBD2463162.1 beta-lactamase family protein [Oscillatoria sp. FACHB-1407]